MNERNEFDDLARRKLEEREFPFHEADWLEAQRLIELQRPSRAWRTWLYAGAGLVLIGAGAWVLSGDTVVEQRPAVQVATTKAGGHIPTATTPSQDPGIGRPEETSAPEGTSPSPTNTSNTAPASIGTTRPSSGSSASRPAEAGPNTSTRARAEAPVMRVDAIVERGTTTLTGTRDTPFAVVRPEESRPREEPSVTSDPSSSQAPSGSVIEAADGVTEKSISDVGHMVVDQQAASDATLENAEPVFPGSAEEVIIEPVPAQQDPILDVAFISTDNSVAADTITTVSTASQAQDSTNSAPSPAAIPPPLITPDSPWELNMLFGGLLSTSSYTGGNSSEWIDGQRGRWSPAFGGEVMHMGRNFGIGSGLHYSTYTEDLRIAERSLTTTETLDSNYFEPFQTTVLHVLGTQIINDEQYYVTESRDTTINVLVLGTTTRTSTRRLIDARDMTNRVSYLEVPLLLDAHAVQGGWAIGLRGGPTIGLLNGRRGALPNATFDGYTDLSTQQFRSPVFGMTARAYVRYRFVNGWSIGLEPTWRTHFGNDIEGGELSRRSVGMGGMMSVSYRLR